MNDTVMVLAADDDPHIREVLRFALENAGFGVTLAKNGKEALKMSLEQKPHLIILDIIMPEINGMDVCREIRKELETPVIFLTSKDDEIDRIVGLEIGADDYITKPFSPRELIARVRAILRRAPLQSLSSVKTEQSEVAKRLLEHGALSMDLDLFKAYWKTREVSLTRTEFALLKTMLNHPGKVFSRDQLMDRAYPEGEIVSDRTIDSHVRRVRRKFAAFGGDPVETVHGLGYRLGDCEVI